MMNTQEELDTLGVGSVIIDAGGLAWQKQRWLFDQIKWMQAGDERPADEDYGPKFPVELLHTMNELRRQ